MMGRRQALRTRYKALAAEVEGVSIFGADDDEHDNAWLTSVLVEPDAAWRPSDLSAALTAEGIESRPLWKPMHLQPVFRDARSLITGAAETLFERGLTLPSGSVLNEEQIQRVLGALERFWAGR